MLLKNIRIRCWSSLIPYVFLMVVLLTPYRALAALTWSTQTWHDPKVWIQQGYILEPGPLAENFLYLLTSITALEQAKEDIARTQTVTSVARTGACPNGNPISVCFENKVAHSKRCTALNNLAIAWDDDWSPYVTLECRGGVEVTNGGWSDWSEWGACSLYSGGVIQTRTRTCTNPTPQGGGLPCTGATEETQMCTGDGTAGTYYTVICTELHRQGLLPDEVMTADAQFGAKMPKVVMDGYHLWAKPLVSLMQKSNTVTTFVNYFAQPWAREMAYQEGVYEHGSYTGKLMMIVGIPISALIGIVSTLL